MLSKWQSSFLTPKVGKALFYPFVVHGILDALVSFFFSGMRKSVRNAVSAFLFVCGGVFLFGTASVCAEVIFSDDFGSDFGELSTHTPTTTGTSWSLLINNGVLLYNQSYNRHVTVQSNMTNAGSFYTADGTYTSADYEISSVVTFSDGGSSYTRSLAVRVQDANNMYLLRYNHAGMTMYRRVSGTWTSIGSASVDIDGNTSASPYHGDTVTFGVIGDELYAEVNGTTELTVTDDNISSAGKAGIGIGRVAVSTDDGGTGVGMDDVVVQTVVLDTTAPTIDTVSSDTANGSYGEGETIDIDVTFSEAVTSTGNVTITLETGDTDRTCSFSVSNATMGTCDYVVQAGDGTDDLAVKTVFGTIADGSGNPMTNFTPATNLDGSKDIAIDTVEPTISGVSAEGGDGSGVITWTTADAASSQVEYGLTENYGETTTEADTSPRVTSHSVVLSDLVSCARYYYRVISEDAEGESVTSSGSTFTTAGCGAGTVDDGSEDVVGASGGEISLDTESGSATLTFPTGYHTEDVTIQLNRLTDSSSAPSGRSLAGDSLFELLAIVVSSGEALSSFAESVTFVIAYGSDTDALDESTFDVYRYEGGSWTAQNCALDTGANTLTCTLDGFSAYGVFGAGLSDEEEDEDEEEEEEAERADVSKWSAYRYDDLTGGDCSRKLRLRVKGHDFDSDPTVKIGGVKARKVERESSKRLNAVFCYDKLLKEKTDWDRKVKVENDDAEGDTAGKRLDPRTIPYRYDAEDFAMGDRHGVHVIQDVLIRLGYLDKAYNTGYYGALTTDAVRRFQADQGLPQVGVVGPLTRAALAAAGR